MSVLETLFSVIFSAGFLSLGIPNELLKTGSALFGLVALVPFYLAMRNTRSWAHAGFLGGLMMMLVHLCTSFWLANFKEYAVFTLGASTLAYFVLGIPAGWFCRFALRRKEHIRPFIFAAVWMIWEWFKSIGFFAYPWGTVSMTSRNLVPLIQIAELTGTWGISYLFALFSAIVAETWLAFRLRNDHSISSVWFRTIVFSTCLIVGTGVYGSIRLATIPAKETSLDVVMVQQNGNSWEEGGTKRSLITSEELTRKAIASEEGKKPDLVIWSESVMTWPYLENKDYYATFPSENPFGLFLRETGVPLLVGSPVTMHKDTGEYSNAVILVEPDGVQKDWYAKMQLIPFAEYIPFTEYEWVRRVFDAMVGFSSGWTPGTEFKHMTVKNKDGEYIQFVTPICFEDAFSSLMARLNDTGSNLIINLTNDSWSKTESAEYQHCTIASFRTIELRTTMIRSTNAGYSVVIDPRGRIIADMPLFVPASVYVSVPIYPHISTFYAQFGDWLPALMSVILLMYGMLLVIVDRRHQLR